MKVNPIQAGIIFRGESQNPEKEKKFNRYSFAPITGYAALGFGVASGVLGAKKKISLHKITALIALVAAAAHIILIKTFHSIGKQSAPQDEKD